MENDFNFNLPESLRPISAWGYFGYQLLFSIPCVGLIMMLIFAFGGAKNINLRNFARSYLLIYVVIIVLTVIMFVIGGMSLAEISSRLPY